MFRGQMEASWKTADLLTGGRSVYVDAIVEPGIYSLGAVGQIDKMVILGRGEAVKRAVWEPVKSRFLKVSLPTSSFRHKYARTGLAKTRS
jgi:hypothetical protein